VGGAPVLVGGVDHVLICYTERNTA
jgi:hypothetical protein